MDLNSVGIVLKRLSNSYNKVALLDKQYGRIECIVHTLDKPVGTLLSYSLLKGQGNLFVKNLQLLYIPLSLGSSDVLFLHHILEIIYYFAPIGSCVHGIFDLLAFLYTIEHMLISMKFKKFFIFKLLMCLGVTPEFEEIPLSLNQLQNININMFVISLMTEECEKQLDKWLWCSLWQHPYINEFKTVHFLEENRAI